MKNILIFILCLGTLICKAEINFDHQRSLEELKLKGKLEGKYIFLDLMASWCGPCKAMDRDVYTDPVLSEFMNGNFISVKVQTDQTKNDEEYTKSWYKDAQALMREFNVTGFPTMVFLTPDGQLAAKVVGYQNAADLLAKAKAAMDPAQQYCTQLNKYLAGDHSPALVDLVAAMAENVGRTIMARKIQGADELSMKGMIKPFAPITDYSGDVQLDTVVTDLHNLPKTVLPPSMIINQTQKEIKIDRISAGNTATETLDYFGQQKDIPLTTSNRVKKAVLWPGDNNTLVEHAEYTYPGSKAELEYIVKETWSLSADKQTLNVERQVKDNNGGYTVTGIYRKR